MDIKVFVDGHQGTTGLQINERLKLRSDVTILEINPTLRKDTSARQRCINDSDVTFLCLPDDAAKQAALLCTDPNTIIIDASTAHRIDPSFAYGLPELGSSFRSKISSSKRIANPGCHATPFNLIMYPLVSMGLLPSTHLASCTSITGYSGGGKSLINTYSDGKDSSFLDSPCMYSLSLDHKHLPEMQKFSGLESPPIFSPIVSTYYKGMLTSIPFYTSQFSTRVDAKVLYDFYTDYFKNEYFVEVMPLESEKDFHLTFLNATEVNDTNKLQIFIFSSDNRILITGRLDNLGKGAGGAAIQNMNIALGLPETLGLI